MPPFPQLSELLRTTGNKQQKSRKRGLVLRWKHYFAPKKHKFIAHSSLSKLVGIWAIAHCPVPSATDILCLVFNDNSNALAWYGSYKIWLTRDDPTFAEPPFLVPHLWFQVDGLPGHNSPSRPAAAPAHPQSQLLATCTRESVTQGVGSPSPLFHLININTDEAAVAALPKSCPGPVKQLLFNPLSGWSRCFPFFILCNKDELSLRTIFFVLEEALES